MLAVVLQRGVSAPNVTGHLGYIIWSPIATGPTARLFLTHSPMEQIIAVGSCGQPLLLKTSSLLEGFEWSAFIISQGSAVETP
jgi:hypothetical protein